MGFDPAIGGEIRKTRLATNVSPAIIVGNDIANREVNRVQVAPLTSNVARLYLAEAHVRLGRAQRKAMADQFGTVSKQRLRDRAGRLSPPDMAAVERAICVQLGL